MKKNETRELTKEEIETLGNIKEAIETLHDLEALFDDRIKEMHNVPGLQSDRHNFLYYRSILWKAKSKLI